MGHNAALKGQNGGGRLQHFEVADGFFYGHNYMGEKKNGKAELIEKYNDVNYMTRNIFKINCP